MLYIYIINIILYVINYKSIVSLNIKYLSVPGIEVEITDIETRITTVYTSIRQAAASINSDIKTLLRREKSQIEMGINTPYRKKYLINIKRG